MAHEFTPAVVEKICPIPKIAWLTIMLTICGLIAEGAVIYMLHMDIIHQYTACIVNMFIIYALFTPMHDASHGSVGRQEYRFLNTLIGHLSACAFPIPFPAFKHIHLQHHKYTNQVDRDPDAWTSCGPTWLLPFKWATIELYYYYLYIGNLAARPFEEGCLTLGILLMWIGIVHTLSLFGYGKEVFWGWILPGRLAGGILALLFDYLPHRPHSHNNQQDIYKATCVTSLYGQESFWLTWPLLHQNYHNIHHLIPYIPFYYYSVVWHAIKTDLINKGTDIIPILGEKVETIKINKKVQ